MTKVTANNTSALCPLMVTVTAVEEQCPICGGDDMGCPFGDWSWGDDEVLADTASSYTAG